MPNRFRTAVGIIGFGTILVGVSVACGSASDSVFGSSPCDTVYKSQCGGSCSIDENCPSGLHCGGDGKCTAECVDDSSCSNGLHCSARGRCGTDTNGLLTGDGGVVGDGSNTVSDAACVDVNLTLTKVIPTVIMLVDQSSSMNDPIGAGGTPARWPTLRNALMNPDGGIIKTLENDVRFGLALYTWNGSHNISTCPEVTSVGVSLGNYNAMNTVYQAAVPIDNTPTGDSILKVAGILGDGGIVDGGLASMASTGPKLIVIATDGDPDSCATNGNNNATAQNITIAAAQKAYDAGIKVYDVAVSSTLNATKQQQVANAGVGLDPNTGDAAVYRADDQATLINAFKTIITSARSCSFALNGTVQSGKESSGTVTLNGTPLGYNDPNGWTLVDPSTIMIQGNACNIVKTTTDATLTAKFPCDAAVITGGPVK